MHSSGRRGTRRRSLYLVRDKPGTPTQFQMIVYASCHDEADGKCRGLAHYLEHLVLVEGNPEHKDAAVRFSRTVMPSGTTSRVRPSTSIRPAREDGRRPILSGCSASMRRGYGFCITPEDAARERNVVLRSMTGASPAGRSRGSRACSIRTLLPDHPSGQWTIGTKEDIDTFTLDDARAFHRNWYALNNTIFVIKGDIESAALKDIADRALTGLVARRLPPRARLQEPQVVIERKDVREEDAQIKRAGLYVKKLFRMEEPDLVANRAARQIVLNFLHSRLPGSPMT
jgi:zinc protease